MMSLPGQLGFPEQGKYEAWVVLEAKSGSPALGWLFRTSAIASRAERGHSLRTTVGFASRADPGSRSVLLLPPGTVHAAGVASSWPRFSRQVISPSGYSTGIGLMKGGIATATRRGGFSLYSLGPRCRRPMCAPTGQRFLSGSCAKCPKFELRRWQGRVSASVPADGRCRIFICLEGKLNIQGQGFSETFSAGQTVLVPIAALPVHVSAVAPDRDACFWKFWWFSEPPGMGLPAFALTSQGITLATRLAARHPAGRGKSGLSNKQPLPPSSQPR